MPTANELFLDLQLQRGVRLESVKKGLSAVALRMLLEAEEELANRVRRSLNSFGRGASYVQTKRARQLLDRISETRGQLFDQMRGNLAGSLRELAVGEAASQLTTAALALPVVVDFVNVPAATLEALVKTRPMDGALLPELFDRVSAAETNRIWKQIRLGILEGDGTDEIVRRVLGRAGTELTRAHVDATVRTAVSTITNAARDEVWRANADIVAGLIWVATLDHRTTLVCRSLDGRVFPVDSGPRPPIHYRCRSLMVAYFDATSRVLAGVRPYVRKGRTVITEIGTVPASLSGEAWLLRQPASFIDEALGSTRGKLLRLGKVPLARMVDQLGWKPYTVAELAVREAEAFAVAGL